MIGRSDPRLLFVEHQDVLGLLTLRCGPFGFVGQRLAVFGHRTAAGLDHLARLLRCELDRVAVDLLDREAVVVGGTRHRVILAVQLLCYLAGYFLSVGVRGLQYERDARPGLRGCFSRALGRWTG